MPLFWPSHLSIKMINRWFLERKQFSIRTLKVLPHSCCWEEGCWLPILDMYPVYSFWKLLEDVLCIPNSNRMCLGMGLLSFSGLEFGGGGVLWIWILYHSVLRISSYSFFDNFLSSISLFFLLKLQFRYWISLTHRIFLSSTLSFNPSVKNSLFLLSYILISKSSYFLLFSVRFVLWLSCSCFTDALFSPKSLRIYMLI